MTREENELLTQTGPGTPCGELMRRYWQPAALSEELPIGGAPLPVRLFGEDLVLFRDEQGRPGLLGLHCAHRGADLSYGRLEDGGLRCIYHGWLYDIHGKVLDMPGEVDGGSAFRKSICQKAYPCQERAGVIFTYMGPGEKLPLFPNYEFLTASDDRVFSTKIYQDCNYLQAHEASVDLLHVSFLHLTHRDRQPRLIEAEPDKLSGRGTAPGSETIEVEITNFGLRVCKIRRVDEGTHYIRTASSVLPNFSVVPGRLDGTAGYLINWHVPIDDTHHWKYITLFSRREPLDKRVEIERHEKIVTDYHSIRNKTNRYLQNRASMLTESYCGMGLLFQDHDTCVAEGMGPKLNRTREHLVPSDVAIVVGRKLLLKTIRHVQDGKDPANVVRNPKLNQFPQIVTTSGSISSSLDWKEHCTRLGEQLAHIGST